MTGQLYLIPTVLAPGPLVPVLPAPVASTLARLDYLIAENPKTARAFLKEIGAWTPLARPIQAIEIRTLNLDTPRAELPALLEPLVAGRDGALVSEAGCPAVADPGAALVALAHARGIAVRPLVGPSALLLALMGSGLNGQRFAFGGYLPRDAAERGERIRARERRSAQEDETQVFIETPYRNDALLAALLETLAPATRLSVAVDLTGQDETILTDTVAAWRRRPAPTLKGRPAVFLFLAASAG